MVTTGIITAINRQVGKTFENNAYEIEIPILNAPGDSPDAVAAKRVIATASAMSGFYNFYDVGDLVYVDFMHGLLNEPIIIGKIYQGLHDDFAGALKVKSLGVLDNAKLPADTVLGELTLKDLLERIADVNNLKERVNQLEKKVKELENATK